MCNFYLPWWGNKYSNLGCRDATLLSIYLYQDARLLFTYLYRINYDNKIKSHVCYPLYVFQFLQATIDFKQPHITLDHL